MKTNSNRPETRFWNHYRSWEAAESAWDDRAKTLETSFPLRGIRHWRPLPGIRAATRKNLRWKALKYLLQHDQNKVMRYFWRKPLRHLRNMIRSYRKPKSYRREGDFFLYGFRSAQAFRKRLSERDTFAVIGFSYCHKPFECPSGRFTDQCIHDLDSPVCGQCFIGKCVHALPAKESIPVFIPTVHYIAEKVIEAMDAHPDKEILFVITACELTLEMFGDWGNAIEIRGIGVRLDGQICNTMKAFEASEKGIKPGMAVVLPPTQKRMLDLISVRRQVAN
jgi:hypothetical protein